MTEAAGDEHKKRYPSFLKYFGKISYSLYLMHYPVLVICKYYFSNYFRNVSAFPVLNN